MLRMTANFVNYRTGLASGAQLPNAAHALPTIES